MYVMRKPWIGTIRELPHMCKAWIHALHNNPWIVCVNCGSTLCTAQSQVPQTKWTGRKSHNRREGLQLAAQGDVMDSYLGLGILRCSLWGSD